MPRTELPFCECGKKVVLTTSWTDKNPGRRFETCVDSGKPGSCGHWDWFDDEMCPRSKQVIPGLIRRLNGKDAFIRDLQDYNAELLAENDELKARVVELEGCAIDDIETEIAAALPLPSSEDEEEDVKSGFKIDDLHNKHANEKKVRAPVMSVAISFAVLIYVWHLMGLV